MAWNRSERLSTPSLENPETQVPNLVGSYNSEADETEPLLKDIQSRMWWSPPIRRYVPVEVVAISFFFSTVLCLPLVQYYLVAKIGEEYGGVNASESNPCAPGTHNSSSYILEQKVQDKAAEYTMFLLFTISFPGIIQTFFFGAMSDKQGRRASLFLAVFGLFLREIIYLIVFELNLPLWVLFVGNAVDGLTGTFGTALTALFGIIADITPPGHKRATRITILQAVMAVSSATGHLITGIWIDAAGFKQPLYFVVALTTFNLFFIVLVLPETRRKTNAEAVFFKEHLKSFKRAFQLYTKDTPDKRRWKLIVSLMTFVTSFSVTLTLATILLLYLLATPFCWKRTAISGYTAARAFINWFCILIVTGKCGRYISEATIAIIACISNALFLLMIGLAQSDLLIILAAVVGIFSEAAPPMVRSIMSRLVSPDEQGAMFASVSGMELLATSVIGVGASIVYKASLSFFPGLIFVILSLLLAVTAALLGTLSCALKKSSTSTFEKFVDEPK